MTLLPAVFGLLREWHTGGSTPVITVMVYVFTGTQYADCFAFAAGDSNVKKNFNLESLIKGKILVLTRAGQVITLIMPLTQSYFNAINTN